MITFARPEAWLLLLPAAAVLVVLARPAGFAGRRLAALLVRLLVVALVVGAAAEPSLERREATPRRLVMLLDVSGSALSDACERGLEALHEIRRADPTATVDAHAFGAGTSRLRWPVSAEDLRDLDDLRDATDVAQALSAGLAAGTPREDVRVVLVTDGHETIGDAGPVARAFRRAGTQLDVIPLTAPTPRSPDPSPRIRTLDAPSVADAGAPLTVRASVDTAGRAGVEAVLRADGREVARAVVETDGDHGPTVTFPPITLPTGPHRLEAVIRGGSRVPDVARAVRVRAGPRALCVRSVASPGRIEASLRTAGIAVEVVATDGLRAALASAAPSDVLVLERDGALRPLLGAFPELLGALRRGMSVVLTDGPGLARTRGTPLLPLLPLVPEPPPPPPPSPDPPDENADPGPGARVKIAEKEALRVALLLIVDTSGSMRGAKLAMARLAGLRAAEALDDQDVIAVLGFADEPYWIVPPTPARQRRRISAGLMAMVAQGQTNVHLALLDGLAALRKLPFGIRHAILLSDGKSPDALYRTMIESAAAERITLSAVAIGDEADSRLLANLAAWGRGAFRWAASPAEIPRIVTDDAIRVLDEAREIEDAPAAAADDDPPAEEDPTEPPPPPVAEPTPEALGISAPHPAMAGIPADEIPPLGGIVPVRGRASAWIALETRDGGRPVLAQWRVGLGRVLVLAADLDGPGADAWRRWPDLARVWAQTVRSLAAASDTASAPALEAILEPTDIRVRAGGGGGSIRLRAIEGDDSRDLETRDMPGGAVEAILPRGDATRSILVEAIGDDGVATALVQEVPRRIRREESASGTSEKRLRELAALAVGRYDPRPEAVLPFPERQRRETLAFWLLAAAALLVPVDVGIRRQG